MPSYFFTLNLIAACWIIFVVVWIVAATTTKRSVYRESTAQRLRYWILLVVAYLLLINGGRLPYPLDARIIPKNNLVAVIALILCVAGLGLAFWARFTLGRNWSGTITLKEGHELIERGPYRWVRHPIYTGLMTMLLATILVLGRVAGIIALALAFLSFWIKLRDEEKLMLEQFPDQYAAYRQRVKCLIPLIL